MPSLPDGIVIFILALLLFGPKKLPVLARELGKWIGEFRRASNEFKMQMEDELRVSEQADRQKEIAAMEAAAPKAPALPTADGVASTIPTEDPEHPHMEAAAYIDPAPETPAPEVLPIATSGELNIMPPSTGLPIAQNASQTDINPLLDSIPSIPVSGHTEPAHAEGPSHG